MIFYSILLQVLMLYYKELMRPSPFELFGNSIQKPLLFMVCRTFLLKKTGLNLHMHCSTINHIHKGTFST